MLLSQTTLNKLLKVLAEDQSDTAYLIVKDFQSIKHFTAIPLKPLTFLYGPNSAGKGIVNDAIEVLVSASKGEDSHDLRKWTRKNTTPIIGISAKASFDDLISGETDRAYLKCNHSHRSPELIFESYEYDGSSTLDSRKRITWLQEFNSDGGTDCTTSTIFIENRKLSEFYSGNNYAELYLNKKRKKQLIFPNELVYFYINDESLSYLIEDIGILEDLKSSLKNENVLIDSKKSRLAINDSPYWFESWSRDGVALRFDITHESSIGINPRTFESWINVLHRGLLNNFFRGPYPYKVGAIRKIPKKEELNFRVGQYSWSRENLQWDMAFEGSETAWRTLTLAYAEKFFNKGNSLIYKRINSWLNSKQYLNTGYSIKAEIESRIKNETPFPTSSNAEISELEISLSIKNPSGHSLELTDVGSGFSQLIPILVASVSGGDIVIIEQPELHLHPALQSKMADIFIESINLDVSSIRDRWSEKDHEWVPKIKARNGYLWARIIESHSEHLLLRLLRRIREKNTGSLSVAPDDVAILYFEPLKTHTIVHRIRVSEDGEFKDRWPQGFFEERDEDLFYGQ